MSNNKVASGEHVIESESIRDGLREREAKLVALRQRLDASIAAGGEATEAEIDAVLEAQAAKLAREGH